MGVRVGVRIKMGTMKWKAMAGAVCLEGRMMREGIESRERIKMINQPPERRH
jgi:hypothetical protein